MKFNLSEDFTIEVGENSYNGTLHREDKDTKNKIKQLIKKEQKVTKEIKLLQLEILRSKSKLEKDGETEESVAEFQKLDAKIEKKIEEHQALETMEEIAKIKFVNCVDCDKEILDLCEKYDYVTVMDAINRDVEDKKK